MPKVFVFLAALVISSPTLASSLTCSLRDKPAASTLKIKYSNNAPIEIHSKPHEETDFKKLEKNIELVFPNDGEGNESFTAKPVLKEAIDWSQEPDCYKQVGSLWYFVFKHQKNEHFVQIAPFLVFENNRCVPPRYTPQDHVLDCAFD